MYIQTYNTIYLFTLFTSNIKIVIILTFMIIFQTKYYYLIIIYII